MSAFDARRNGRVGLAIGVLATGLAIAAPAASAAGWDELAALADCDSSVAEVGVTLDGDVLRPDEHVVVGCQVLLDLGGHQLHLDHIEIEPTAALTIRDSGTTGKLWASSASASAGIVVREGATLSIESGHVEAYSSQGAGIGGSVNLERPGEIHISGGRVEAYGGGSILFGAAGIGGGHGGSGGTVTITGGDVFARGSERAAGIGGGFNGSGVIAGDGGHVVISGGTVTAHSQGRGAGIGGATRASGGIVDIRDGVQKVTASSAHYGAGIGGGQRGDGGTVTISGGSVVARGVDAPAIGQGCQGSSSGRITIGAAAVVDADASRETFDCPGLPAITFGGEAPSLVVEGQLRVFGSDALPIVVPDNGDGPAHIVVEDGGVVSGPEKSEQAGAGFTGTGMIENHGTIAFAESLIGDGVRVNDHNFLHTFTPREGGQTEVRVYAETFLDGYRTAPRVTVDGGRWAVEASEDSHWWEPRAELTGDVVLVEAVPDIAVTVSGPAEVVAGAEVEITAIVSDQFGDRPGRELVYQSDMGDSFEEHRFRPTTTGPRTVTVTDAESGASGAVDVSVVPGPAVAVTLTASSSSVEEGGTVTFTVAAVDEYGNEVDASAVDLTGDGVEIEGRTVRFPSAGSSTISAEVDGVTGSATVEVHALPRTITIDQPGPLTAGDTVDIVAVVSNEHGPIDPQPSLTYRSNRQEDDGDRFDGNRFTATRAGRRTITVMDDRGTTAIIEVTVAPAPVAQLELIPSVTAVNQGGRVRFTVNGIDAHGNPVDTSRVRLYSASHPEVDRIDGLTVTFPHASAHVITAELDGVTASATIEVIPTPTTPTTPTTPPPSSPITPPPPTTIPPPPAAELPATGGGATGVLLLAAVAVAMGVVGSLAVRRRRPTRAG